MINETCLHTSVAACCLMSMHYWPEVLWLIVNFQKLYAMTLTIIE
jgi:hypothetical protein